VPDLFILLKLRKNFAIGNNVKDDSVQGKADRSTLRWIAAIFLISAILGGLLTMNDKPVEPNGYVQEGNFEENGNPDTFVGTP
jgi:hypothetical protein